MKKLLVAFVLAATPALAQPVPPVTSEAILQNMIGNLAGQNAQLSARLDQLVKQNEQLTKELADLKKAHSGGPNAK